MKKMLNVFAKGLLFIIMFSCGCLFIFTACGHNVAQNSKGWGVDVSWNTDSYLPTARLGYWDVSSAVVKQNTNVQVVSNGSLGLNGVQKTNENGLVDGNVNSIVKIQTGQQINGYTKDVLTSSDLKQTNVDVAKEIFGNKNVTEIAPIEVKIKTDETRNIED